MGRRRPALVPARHPARHGRGVRPWRRLVARHRHPCAARSPGGEVARRRPVRRPVARRRSCPAATRAPRPSHCLACRPASVLVTPANCPSGSCRPAAVPPRRRSHPAGAVRPAATADTPSAAESFYRPGRRPCGAVDAGVRWSGGQLTCPPAPAPPAPASRPLWGSRVLGVPSSQWSGGRRSAAGERGPWGWSGRPGARSASPSAGRWAPSAAGGGPGAGCCPGAFGLASSRWVVARSAALRSGRPSRRLLWRPSGGLRGGRRRPYRRRPGRLG